MNTKDTDEQALIILCEHEFGAGVDFILVQLTSFYDGFQCYLTYFKTRNVLIALQN